MPAVGASIRNYDINPLRTPGRVASHFVDGDGSQSYLLQRKHSLRDLEAKRLTSKRRAVTFADQKASRAKSGDNRGTEDNDEDDITRAKWVQDIRARERRG